MQRSKLSPTSSSTNHNIRLSHTSTKKTASEKKSVLYRPTSTTPKKKKEWDSTISNLNVYKLSKQEMEAKKKSRISKNQEYFKNHSPESYHPIRLLNYEERPCSAPPTRNKPLTTPTKQSSNFKAPRTVPVSTKSKSFSKSSKLPSNNTLPSFNIDLNNTQFLNPSKFKQHMEFPQLDLLPLTSRILQQENSETSSESDKDKSLTNVGDIFQEDDFHRFGEWSSNLQGEGQVQTSNGGLVFDATSNRVSDIDFIKNELLDLRSNMMFKIDSGSRVFETLLEEKTKKECELEEKAKYLEQELDQSRRSYEELDLRFSLYRKDSEERTLSLLQRIDELEREMASKSNGLSSSSDPSLSMDHHGDPASDYVINGRKVLKTIDDSLMVTTPKNNQMTPPLPVLQFDTKPFCKKTSPTQQNNNRFSDDNKENIEIVKNGEECSPFSTYRYPVQFNDNTIEIHRPLIIGRDFSNTIQRNQLPSRQNKDFSPPSSTGSNNVQAVLSNKVKKFNIREKH
ncbi:hypothetical protein C9374_003671 [Naegleria lovaniensis]|uniref:Uncharacterized protein n=1 Tax=Naegleria lovaniensis TaxID=51637 RepID=A0AA88KS87_NAELO|nr:uncharacterized protein C9374_003671 [Naegleria lovaniensis]KAG2393907.1 hypothetical protein C9374_003671 [Naegleria lovaniensis]